MKYQIQDKNGMHTLYSVVATSFGGSARNYIASSTNISEVERIAVSLGAKEIEYVG